MKLSMPLHAGLALAACLLLAGPAQARAVTLAFDAHYLKATVIHKSPSGDSVGDRQVVSGILRDVAGKKVGKFAFACTYTAIIGDDAREQCSGTGGTADGGIRFQGPARKQSFNHSWTFTGTSGRLKGAHGKGLVHDPTPDDSTVVMQVVTNSAERLRAGVAPRSPANQRFIRSVTTPCTAAHDGYGTLPPFPFPDFDPFHPDASQLHDIGSFFAGPGDARPIERRLLADLAKVGKPRAAASLWKRIPALVQQRIETQNRQTAAALASNVSDFLATVHEAEANVAALSLASRAFGAPACDV